MPTFLVTGSDGFIGRHLTPKLAQIGTVYTYDLRDGNDITDKDRLLAAAEGKDVIIHLAGLTDTRAAHDELDRYDAVNHKGTQNVLAAAEAHQAKVIYTSTCDLYQSNPDPITEDSHLIPKDSVYAVSKFWAESAVIRSKQAVVLRLFNPYGPYQSPNRVIYQFLKAALYKDALKVYGDGTTLLDYVYVTDIADAIVRSLEFPQGTVVNVASGRGHSILEIAEMITTKYGSHIVHISTPKGIEIRQLVGSTERMQTISERWGEPTTAWKSTTSLAAGIDNTMAWLMETL